MKIMVIGSEGNIGSRLVPYLRKQGHEVVRADIRQKFGYDYYLVDINVAGDVFAAVQKERPDAIYGLAAMVSRITCEESPCITVDTNLSGVNNMVQAAKSVDAKFIYFSTSEVYGNIEGELSEDRTDLKPNNRYGLVKYLGEKIVEYEVQNYDLQAVTVRPFMFYDEEETFGENRSAMIRFAENLTRKKSVEVHIGAKRSWMHMSDAVEALEKVLYVPEYRRINIGHPQMFDMGQVAQMMCDRLYIEYEKYVQDIEQPDKMTLNKTPDLTRQTMMLGVVPAVTLDVGIDRVLSRVRQRIALEGQE